MYNKRLHYRILFGALFVYLLICFDVWYSPSVYRAENIMSAVRYSGFSIGGIAYKIRTDKSTYQVTSDLYFAAKDNSNNKLIIEQSKFSRSHRSMMIMKDGTVFTMEKNFTKESGCYFMFWFSLFTIMFVFLYDKVKYVPGRLQLSIFLGSLAILMLLLHLFA